MTARPAAALVIPTLIITALVQVRPVTAAAPAPSVTTIHPIFATSDVPGAEDAHRAFKAAMARHGLGAVVVMEIPGPPAAKAKSLLEGGRKAVAAQRFEEAQSALRAASNEAAVTGAAGLSTADLSDLFLLLGMAIQKVAPVANPPSSADAEPSAGKDPATRAAKDPAANTVGTAAIAAPAAVEAYLRAATLAPERKLTAPEYPVPVIAAFEAASAEIAKRPRANLRVRAPATALVSIDGSPPRDALLPALDLPAGDHWVRVEEPGRRPWGTMITLTGPSREIEVPDQPALSLGDAGPAALARRQGAAFALVGELRPGRPAALELRLVHAVSGKRKDSATIALSDPAALEIAVAKLDEIARRQRFAESPAAVVAAPALGEIALASVEERPLLHARFSDSPSTWAKQRWPLLTAVGVAVGSALALGLLVAHDDGR